jgi:hypothetical protein
MKTKDKKTEYKTGKIGQMVQFIAATYNLDEKLLRAQLVLNFPELKNKVHCANCEASMLAYPCTFTYFASELLLEMAGIVNSRLEQGMPFTEANQVHRRQITRGYTIASQFTIASKLGLVAKIMKVNKEGNNVMDQEKG